MNESEMNEKIILVYKTANTCVQEQNFFAEVVKRDPPKQLLI